MQSSEAYRVTIGVTSADGSLPENYINAIQGFGARAIVLPNRVDDLDADFGQLDGLCSTGGTDINPACYGAIAHVETDVPDLARDAYECAAIRRATEYGIPLLMICRGMQMGNIVFGGTLHQHLPDIVEGVVIHNDCKRKFEVFDEHMVTLEAESFLMEMIKETRFATNGSHHQAIDRLGSDLRVVARTSDGTIEAIERPSAPAFWLGIQWHPERLLNRDEGRSERIFQAFLRACQQYANVK